MHFETFTTLANKMKIPQKMRATFCLAVAILSISGISIFCAAPPVTTLIQPLPTALDLKEAISLAICGLLILHLRKKFVINPVQNPLTEIPGHQQKILLLTGLALAVIGLFSSNRVTGIMFVLVGLGFSSSSMNPKNPLTWQIFPFAGLMLGVLIANAFMLNFDLTQSGLQASWLHFFSNLAFVFIFINQIFLGGGVGILKPFHTHLIGAKVLRVRGPLAIFLFLILAKLLHIGVAENLYGAHFGVVLFLTVAGVMFFFVFHDLAVEFNHAHQRIQDSETSQNKLMAILTRQNALLEKKRARLERSNHDLEIFAGAAAHDLKSPLQSTISWIGILRESLAGISIPLANQAIAVIKRNAEKSIALVNDLLEISRLNGSHGVIEDVNVNEVLQHLKIVLAENLAQSGCTLNLGKLPTVKAVSAQIENVFSNLLRNAINYREKSRPLIITITHIENKDDFEFCVEDNGIGIPSDKLEKIFVLFHRVHTADDDDYQGTGMGLAYCQKAIELHGGKIWATSELGKSSQFHFTIPKV